MNTVATAAPSLPASRAPAALPFGRRVQWKLFRAWLRLCRQAERRTRVVPRY